MPFLGHLGHAQPLRLLRPSATLHLNIPSRHTFAPSLHSTLSLPTPPLSPGTHASLEWPPAFRPHTRTSSRARDTRRVQARPVCAGRRPLNAARHASPQPRYEQEKGPAAPPPPAARCITSCLSPTHRTARPGLRTAVSRPHSAVHLRCAFCQVAHKHVSALRRRLRLRVVYHSHCSLCTTHPALPLPQRPFFPAERRSPRRRGLPPPLKKPAGAHAVKLAHRLQSIVRLK